MLHVSGILSFLWLPPYFLYCFFKEDVCSVSYGCFKVSITSVVWPLHSPAHAYKQPPR